MKKAQTGRNVPKGMVESEMNPGKMIPKSKSNYENGNYNKMLEAGKKGDTSRKMGLNFDKKSFDKLPKLKTKKAEKGDSFGMLSVKAGVDKNPNPTAADRIAGAKKMAKFGKKVVKKVVKKASYGKMMKGGGKCKNGC